MEEVEQIEYMCICDERYCMSTDVNPSDSYDDIIERLGNNMEPLYIKYVGQEEKRIHKYEYIELLEEYNKKVGLTPIKNSSSRHLLIFTHIIVMINNIS